MDALLRYVSLLVYDRSVVRVHFVVRLETISPDLSQRLGEVFSLLNHWFKIALIVDSTLPTNHPE
jgi:hypothetical protein